MAVANGLYENSKNTFPETEQLYFFKYGTTPSQIIEGCSKNATLYTIFEFDRRYRLMSDGLPIDDTKELQRATEKLFNMNGLRPEPMPSFYSADLKQLLQNLNSLQIPSLNNTFIKKVK